MAYTLAPLAYEFNALEPYIDALTMEIHHDRHHNAYITNLNNAIHGTALEEVQLIDLLRHISKHPAAVRNNGGGHFNHDLFWKVIGPNAGGHPTGPLSNAIDEAFGTFDLFKEEFAKAATTRFGSGWAWLLVAEGKLKISSTPNQDNPLMDVAEVHGTPILGLDVWEHAYYLKYQNKRPDYIAGFWNVVNWDAVSDLYLGAV
jgi:Fe-Mn family superoxide dismutase